MPARWLLKTDIPLYFPGEQLPQYAEPDLANLTQNYLTEPTQTKRDKLIESQIRLTLTIASMYLARHPQHPNELVSDSLFALVKAIDRFPKVARDTNISAYVNRTIWYSLKQAVLRNKLIPIPRMTLFRKLKQGTLKPIDVVSILSHDIPFEPVNRVDEEDFLNVHIQSDEDRRILRMRVARYEGKEIAEQLKVKVSYVWQRCRKIQQTLSLLQGA